MSTHTVLVELDERVYRNLEALTGGQYGPRDVAGVLAELADHADQGVWRPGAWERHWLIQVFGDEWLAKVEDDPRDLDIGWQRPIAAPEAGAPR